MTAGVRAAPPTGPGLPLAFEGVGYPRHLLLRACTRLEVHVASGAEDDLCVSEIWASRERFQAYGERLKPILEDIGITFSGEPEVFETYNLVK